MKLKWLNNSENEKRSGFYENILEIIKASAYEAPVHIAYDVQKWLISSDQRIVRELTVCKKDVILIALITSYNLKIFNRKIIAIIRHYDISSLFSYAIVNLLDYPAIILLYHLITPSCSKADTVYINPPVIKLFRNNPKTIVDQNS